jgi:hypothetical protein
VVAVAITIYALACLIALAHPRVGILLFWPVMYCYPSWLLLNVLPLNAGLDDVFLVCLFVGSFIRSGEGLQIKWPFWASILFCLICIFGDAVSVLAGDIGLGDCWKQWLKSAGLILFVYSVSSMIKTPRQIRIAIYAFLFGALSGAVFVIFYTVFPDAYNPFQPPPWAMGPGWWGKQIIGPFVDTTIAAGVLGFAVLIGYFHIRFGKKRYKRSVIIFVTGVSVLGLILCTARSGWVFVASTVILSSLFSKNKLPAIILLALITIMIYFSFTHFEIFSKRISKTMYQMEGGTAAGLTSDRFGIWVHHLSNPKISWLFCGEGFVEMKGAHAHSNYVGIIMNMGFAGILFWLAYYIKVMKKSSWLSRYDADPDMAVLFKGVFWCYIGYFVYFIVATPAQFPQVRYVDFFLMTLICLRYQQVESEAAYVAEEEEAYLAELEYEQIHETG